MPMYEFICEVCGLRFTEIFGIDDAPEYSTCHCGERAKRVPSVVSFSFKF